MAATDVGTMKNFIDGEWVEPSGGTDTVFNPATGEELAQAPVSTPEDVDRAVKAASDAFEGWSNTTPGERALALIRLADALEEHGEEIAALEIANAGKPAAAFKGDELPVMADNLRFFAGCARTLEGKAAGEYVEGYTSFVRREAIGPVAQITPWNYPLMMAIWKIGPALAAGNTIVLKPAETTPLTTLKLGEIAAEFLPKGVLNVIGGRGETGQALVQHPDIRMVSLTGSVETGKWIARAAADTLKRVHLELGGKAPVVVFDDADMEPSLETIAGTGFYNAGQDCTAATRVLASSKVYDDGRSRASPTRPRATRWATSTTRRPRSARSTPQRQRERVAGFIERRPDHAEIVTGGKQPDQPGYWFEPTVVGGLRAGRRDDPARDLRPGHHGPAVLRRGRGDRVGERHEVRPRLLGLDPRRRPRAARLQGAALRLRVDQRPHPARARDAARRLRRVRLRQGPLDVRRRGVHASQARHGEPRSA